MSNPKTLSPGTLDVTLSGLINAYGSIGVYQVGTAGPQTIDAAVIGRAPKHFTVHNTGTIISHGTSQYDAGIVLGAAGTVFNTGTIIAGTGLAIFGTAGTNSLSNTGEIFGTLGVGLSSGEFADITNSKYIFGAQTGLELAGGGFIDNTAGATITSSDGAAIEAKLFATITNAGTLAGRYTGIFLQSGGTVGNTGLILQTNSNSNAAAIESYQAASVTNAGTIEGGNGIKFEVGTATGAVYVTNSGTIDAVSTIDVNGNFATGFLTYGVGIYAETGGEVVNSNVISGNHVGIVFEHATGTVINTGLISASVGYGVYLNNGGTIFNAGTIAGYSQGIFAGSDGVDYANITNTGLVSASKLPTAGAFTVGSTGQLVTYISTAIFQLALGTIDNAGTVSDPNGQGIGLVAYYDDFLTGVAGYGHGTMINSGTVTAQYGLIFAGVGGVTNTGTVVTEDTGIQVNTTLAQVYNSNLISASGATFSNAYGTFTATGVILKQGGTITNAATGTIAAPGGHAIHAYGASAYVYNNGLISAGKVGIFLAAGGSIHNAGAITAGTSGIYNQGTGDLTVYNAFNGVISGAHNGVNNDAGPGTLRNLGTIIATDTTFTHDGSIAISHGVLFQYGGSINNYIVGTISGDTGIAVSGTEAAYVYNAGQVTGTGRAGIYLQSAGTVINAEPGVIRAGRPGVELYGGGYVSNAGAIYAGRAGLYLKTGGTAANTGYISAATTGIYALSGAATITNAGAIVGGQDGIILKAGGTIIDTGAIIGATYAISFATGFANLLVVDAGSDIDGTVNGGNGILELAADGTTIGTVSTETQLQFANFGSVEIDAGGTWDFAGAFTIAGANALLNNGIIRESSADKLVIDSALTGTGAVELSKKVLTLNGSVASGEKISFSGTSEILALGDAKKFEAKIEKFTLGDTIDLTSISLSAITATHFASGVLTLNEGSAKLLFTFASPSSFAHDTFAVAAAGHGTAITLAPAAASLLPVTQVTTLAPLATFTT